MTVAPASPLSRIRWGLIVALFVALANPSSAAEPELILAAQRGDVDTVESLVGASASLGRGERTP